VEILKQGQYQPLPLEKQVVIIFAGVKGFLDDLPVERCRQFEAELYTFIDNAHAGLWEEIRSKKALDDALTAKVTAAIKEFKAGFIAEKKPEKKPENQPEKQPDKKPEDQPENQPEKK